MIRFAIRLTVVGGREAVTRLVIIAGAVALGVALLLAPIAATNALGAQNQRYAWLNTAVAPTVKGGDSLLWLIHGDYYHGRTIGRVEVAAQGAHAPLPPGIPRLPRPGEYYVSPALGELLATTPPAELGDRFPGHDIGVIGDAALPSPDSLLVVIGRTPADLTALGATRATQIMTTAPSGCGQCYAGFNANDIAVALSVVAAALIFPVLIFIATATRLAAARREQRFAAMRLVGATPRQISLLSAVESTLAAAVGTAVGLGLFLAARPSLARIPFTGERFFVADLSLTAPDLLGVALGVPAGAVVAAGLALRRVRISPLGVSRRVTPRPPRGWRALPLVVGLAELGYFVGRRPASTNGQLIAYVTGFVVILVGLVLAGPWLTMQSARVLAGRARRPATLIAGRRLADDPRAAFRSVSGLIVALFVTTVATGAITTFVAHRGAPRTDSVEATAVHKIFWPEDGPAPTPARIPAGLGSIPGVRDVTLVHRADDGGHWLAVITCSDLDRLAVYGRCPPGARVAAVNPGLVDTPGTEIEAADLDPAAVAGLPIMSVVVNTANHAALEQARTLLENAFPRGQPPASEGEREADNSQDLVRLQQLASVVIIGSLPIAGCSLAVSVASGLSDRRRPFSLLRLTGVQLATLRQVVAIESLLPLLASAAVAIGLGFLAAELFLRAQLGYTLTPPGWVYYAVVTGGLALSLTIIASTLPLLQRITGPDTARNE